MYVIHNKIADGYLKFTSDRLPDGLFSGLASAQLFEDKGDAYKKLFEIVAVWDEALYALDIVEVDVKYTIDNRFNPPVHRKEIKLL